MQQLKGIGRDSGFEDVDNKSPPAKQRIVNPLNPKMSCQQLN